MTGDLKPCPLPWCASPAKRDRWEGEYVCCSSEACPLSRAIYREETWNRRAPSPSVALLVEACRDLIPTLRSGDWGNQDETADRLDEALAAVEKEIGQ